MTKKLKSGDKVRVEGELKQLLWCEEKQEFDLVDVPKEVKPLHVGGLTNSSEVSWAPFGAGIMLNLNRELKILFNTAEGAKLFTRSIELRKKARQAMSRDWGDERPDWENPRQFVYCIRLTKRYLHVTTRSLGHEVLHFRTKEAAENFRDSITVEDYLLIVGL